MIHRPKRVLHIVRGMMRAGAETWLMHVLRRLNPDRVRMDFLVHMREECHYDQEIESRGCGIFRLCYSPHSLKYGRAIRNLLREQAYDAVHSHVHHFSGYLLLLARTAGIRLRIAHSHNDTSRLDDAAAFLRRGYLTMMEHCIQAHANRMVGASRAAGKSLFGSDWLRDPRSRLLFCGVDLAPFRALPSRSQARAELGIGEQELVIGHVGRFEAQKNHAFLIEVATRVVRHHAGTRTILVGDGSLREAIAERVRETGISERVLFAGVRQDIPRLLAGMDVFLFPSHHEGLGLALVEAQAAGLPCVISDVVPPEADVVPSLIHRLAIAAGPDAWADTVLQAANAARPAQPQCLDAIEGGSLDIRRSVEDLYALYGA